MKKQKNLRHYVPNKDFYDALVEYKKKWKPIEDAWYEKYGEERSALLKAGVKKKDIHKYLPEISYPRVPEFIGKCMYLIATNLSNSPNFARYSYKEDMIADGYEDCIRHVRRFDPEITNNPFAYFTQTCYFAAVRRIKKEGHQKKIKSRLIVNSGILDEMQSSRMDGDDQVYDNSYLKFLSDAVDTNENQKNDQPKSKFNIKKTTKAYQKKMKELEEKEKQFIESIEGKQDESIDFDEYKIEEDYDYGDMNSLFSGDDE